MVLPAGPQASGPRASAQRFHPGGGLCTARAPRGAGSEAALGQPNFMESLAIFFVFVFFFPNFGHGSTSKI